MTTTAQVPAPVHARHRPPAVLTALVLVVLSYGLPQTMTVPAMTVIQHDLRADPASASWAVLSSTLLASAVCTPLAGRLADRYGTRRVLLGSLALYLAGTLGAIVAPDIGALIAARAVQGISLALLPLSFAIVRRTLPPDRVAFGLALTAGLVGTTAGAGLLVGGVLVDHFSWRWLFVVGAVLVLAALAAAIAFVPPLPGTPGGRLDVPGALTLATGLVAVLLGITQGPSWGWGSPAVLGLFAGGLAVLAAFVVIERRTAHPVIDIGLLVHRPLLIAHLGAFALGANQFVFYALLPKLAQLPAGPGEIGFGATVTGAALMLLPGTLLTLPASWAVPRIERRFGHRVPLWIGLGLAACGGVLLAVLHGSLWQVLACYLVCSTGYGFAMAALPTLVNAGSTPEHSGSANGVNTVARTVGGAAGSQIGAAILAGTVLPGTTTPTSAGFASAFLAAAVMTGLGVLLLPLLARAKFGRAVPGAVPGR
ncbi:MFS transporter [Spongiactinospora sp. TRM90649]|uniref:MFS transporter n=1 Tax=Spongiactinospora sp. TRM90649 TaxID=3031114 RepID=UPI0023F63916|nr:MFS transporter [Spongiactinospora sp. TRM90649]MDF5754485.1 MFS transporter [Spongiactinospora sp. TRM90649]